MNEAMATGEGRVSPAFEVLYRTWAEGGSGLLITGNIMVDGAHANEPLAVAVENERDAEPLAHWQVRLSQKVGKCGRS